MLEPLVAVAMQPEVRAFYITGKTPEDQRKENIERYCKLIDRYVLAAEHRSSGIPPRLVVFPESFIHGFGPVRKRDWKIYQQLAIQIPGDEIEALGKKCKEYGFYLAGAAYEKLDPEFPDKIFNTGFIIDPNGNVALKYRKINTTNNPIELATSPCDILDKYGRDPKKLFPVLETPYGYFGIYICYDGTFPEVARCLGLNGAEVLIRPNNWWYGSVEFLDMMTMMNRLRAFENTAYLVTCNWAHSPLSEYESSCGHAMIVDYEGRILSEKLGNDETFCSARLDVNALRQHRLRDKSRNFLSQLRPEAYATVYGSHTCFPPNLSMDKDTAWQTLDEKWALYDGIVDRLKKEGVVH